MIRTYKAIQVTKPGKLNLVELPIREPGPGQVRIRVEACGVCHSDVATVEGQYPGLILPRVPGHEVVGRGDAVGPDVSNWKIGQRVGVGFFGGQDDQCDSCQRGDFVNCLHPVVTGITVDGGYAEVSGVTRTYRWRIEQLDRMARLVGENEIALQQKGASEIMENPDRFTQKLLLRRISIWKSEPLEQEISRKRSQSGH